MRPHENWFIYHTHGLNHLSFLQHLNDATTNLHGSHCPLLIMHNYRCVGSFSHANEEYSMWFTWLKESTINKSLVKLFHRLQSPIKKIKNPMSHCNLQHCSPSNGWWIGLDEQCRSPYWCLNINILISLSLSLLHDSRQGEGGWTYTTSTKTQQYWYYILNKPWQMIKGIDDQ